VDPGAFGEQRRTLTEVSGCDKGGAHFHELIRVPGRFEKVGAVRPAFFFHLSRGAAS
jgi:hypothetical protein